MKFVYLGSEGGYEAAKATADGRVEILHAGAEPGAVADALPGAGALIDASMKVRIDEAILARADSLRIISTATTGSDHIDRAATEARSIRVRTLKESPEVLKNITPAAELSWALLMACARRIVPASEHTRSGRWVREDFPGIMLRGKTLGLVGCGRIGQWMARYASAFGMRVIGHDPYVSPWPEDIEKTDVRGVMANADFISMHVHLSEKTRGLVGRPEFEIVKPGAIFINTSRGAVADETALLDALLSGRLAGAGLDVLEGEPDIDSHPLIEYCRAHDNLIVTPHCGGFSPDAVAMVCAHATEVAMRELGMQTAESAS